MDRTSHVGTYNILYRFKSNACVENEFDGLNNNNNEKETTLSISLRCKNLKTTIYVFRMESGLQYRGGFTTIRTYTRRHEFIARLENRERVASTSTYAGYPSGTSYIHTYIMYSYNIYIIINSVCVVFVRRRPFFVLARRQHRPTVWINDTRYTSAGRGVRGCKICHSTIIIYDILTNTIFIMYFDSWRRVIEIPQWHMHINIYIYMYWGFPVELHEGWLRCRVYDYTKRALRIITMEVIDTRQLGGNDHCSDDVRGERRYTGLYTYIHYIMCYIGKEKCLFW